MNISTAAKALTFSAALIFPAQSLASEHVTLTFLGVASPGINESIYPYSSAGQAALPAGGHYNGPVSITVSISDFDTATPYVDAFSINWADAANGPYYAGWQGTGSVDTGNFFDATSYSKVSVDDAGGSIKIYSSPGYISKYDGSFLLNLNFALDDLQTFRTSFDDLLSGGGTVSGSTNMSKDPVIGYFDSDVSGGFTLSSVKAVVSGIPEPGAWAMMIAGFFGLGAVLRRRRAADAAAA